MRFRMSLLGEIRWAGYSEQPSIFAIYYDYGKEYERTVIPEGALLETATDADFDDHVPASELSALPRDIWPEFWADDRWYRMPREGIALVYNARVTPVD
jgi:hypothetical protein